jgi:hypothetical protein
MGGASASVERPAARWGGTPSLRRTRTLAGGRPRRSRLCAHVSPGADRLRRRAGLALAGGDVVLGRTLALAGEEGRDTGWLCKRTLAEGTSRLDLAFTVDETHLTAADPHFSHQARREVVLGRSVRRLLRTGGGPVTSYPAYVLPAPRPAPPAAGAHRRLTRRRSHERALPHHARRVPIVTLMPRPHPCRTSGPC